MHGIYWGKKSCVHFEISIQNQISSSILYVIFFWLLLWFYCQLFIFATLVFVESEWFFNESFFFEQLIITFFNTLLKYEVFIQKWISLLWNAFKTQSIHFSDPFIEFSISHEVIGTKSLNSKIKLYSIFSSYFVSNSCNEEEFRALIWLISLQLAISMGTGALLSMRHLNRFYLGCNIIYYRWHFQRNLKSSKLKRFDKIFW